MKIAIVGQQDFSSDITSAFDGYESSLKSAGRSA